MFFICGLVACIDVGVMVAFIASEEGGTQVLAGTLWQPRFVSVEDWKNIDFG